MLASRISTLVNGRECQIVRSVTLHLALVDQAVERGACGPHRRRQYVGDPSGGILHTLNYDASSGAATIFGKLAFELIGVPREFQLEHPSPAPENT